MAPGELKFIPIAYGYLDNPKKYLSNTRSAATKLARRDGSYGFDVGDLVQGKGFWVRRHPVS